MRRQCSDVTACCKNAAGRFVINVKGGIVEAVDRLPVGLQVSLVPSLCPAMNFERKSAQSRVPGCFDDVRGAVQRSDVKRSVFVSEIRDQCQGLATL
jgi:hypothetical protein